MAMNPGFQRQLVDDHIDQLRRTAGPPKEREAECHPAPDAFAVALRPSPTGRLSRRVGTWLVHAGQRLGGPAALSAGSTGWEPGLLGPQGSGHGSFDPGC
jgi:hypothetical protein